MLNEYDLNCIKEISCKTGINENKAQKYYENNDKDIEKTLIDIQKKISMGIIEITGSETAGFVYGNVSDASTIYGMDKFNTSRGHGFAAERANHIYDKMTGKKASVVGDNNLKNGPDRLVDGINIQSKYCSSGSKCISECFENGKFRYWNADGSPMEIEVPSDKYDDAVKAMKNRISKGQVSGVTNPEDAEKIVRKGNFTYEQAKNIAKFGTVESLKYDAVNGLIISTSAMGISATITFAVSMWNGDEFGEAIKKAAYSGIKVGGITFISAILSSQLSRTGLNSALVGSTEAIVEIMGPKASALLVNAFRSGTNIYGAAAMKSASKLLRGNIITGALSVAILSSVDVVNIFRGRISGAQLFKNVANTASTVAGGTAGWVGGAAAGAALGSVIPILGTAVGGFVGGLLGSFAGGSVAGTVSSAVLDEFIEDDANEMIRIIEDIFQELASDYLLNKEEAEKIVDNLQNSLDSDVLKDMYASSNRENFAHNLLIDDVEYEVKNRKKIIMPNPKEMVNGVREVLEEISDNNEVTIY